MKIVALDIGGTAVKYGIFEKEKKSFGQFSVKQPDGSENIPMCLCNFVKDHKPDVVAVSSPGPFDFESGTGFMTHKLTSMLNISLKEKIKEILPLAKSIFVHDSTAFAVGAISQNPLLTEKRFAAVMLGTGLGYTVSEKGKILLNEKQTPRCSLWNQAFLDGITEDYVSTRALRGNAEACGIKAENVLCLAEMAKQGNADVLRIFESYGTYLGMCVQEAGKRDSFSDLVIGGQISKSWELIKDGFERACSISYEVVKEPQTCALYGLYACAMQGKETYYKISE